MQTQLNTFLMSQAFSFLTNSTLRHYQPTLLKLIFHINSHQLYFSQDLQVYDTSVSAQGYPYIHFLYIFTGETILD